MQLINLTPHAIVLRSPKGGDTTVPTSGIVARVSSVSGTPEIFDGVPVPVYPTQTWGEIEGLPAPQEGTLYIVSAMVLGRVQGRSDVVAPGTGPNDGAIRDEGGRIRAVTRLVR